MDSFLSGLNITDRNTDIPFFPNVNWLLEASDVNVRNLPVFNWIQAFYDPLTVTDAHLCVYSGAADNSGNPICSYVRFAYSGERINVKGMGIFSAGVTIRGQSISSSTVGTEITQIIAWGGMR